MICTGYIQGPISMELLKQQLVLNNFLLSKKVQDTS